MAIYDYGIGGNEVNVDANESIADIPSNRTLLVQKLTDEAPVSPEAVYGLQTVEDVFEHFSPSVTLKMITVKMLQRRCTLRILEILTQKS